MGHQSYVLLCSTTLSNPPVVIPKSSCDVHLLRSPWIIIPVNPFETASKDPKLSTDLRQFLVSTKSRNRTKSSEGSSTENRKNKLLVHE